MSQLSGDERARYVQHVFGSIARRYNLMNRLMTAGQDIRWRRETVRRLQLNPGDALLDLGAGTGDLGREALRQQPGIRLVAADFSLAMLLAGKSSGRLPWLNADALHLPFPGATFEAVVSGFLMRNVSNLKSALAEQYRILKPGGRLLILETTRPRSGILSPFVRFHMHYLIPWIGGLVSGDREAYRYLPASSEAFLSAEELAERIISAGFRNVGFKRRMAGTIAIHWGMKNF
ncbi:MAG: ubiquinone/menaquinone biosynthesis methyltransferase [Anaerolineales bacterium]|jgi:demethylmenaquinone methyltransferase/2-methoxy-6-polyprenyl-1,4-benzoquinol methylase